jgi:hypothetical protein
VPSEWRERFLKHLAQYGNVSKAAVAAGVSRKYVYTQREADAEFSQAWADAIDQAGDVMEAEAWRRAVKGTKKPVYQSGALVGHVQEYSDTLLIFLLKAARPDKFRENSRTLQINTTPADLAAMSDEELDKLERRLTTS